MKSIRIADEAPSPGARRRALGDYSGDWYRDEILRPELAGAIARGEQLEVVLDGAAGYPVSFLEEVFGGLIRSHVFDSDIILKTLVITARDELYAPFKALAERKMLSAVQQQRRSISTEE